MNIFEPTKIGGHWWNLEFPDQRLGGILEIEPDKDIQLTLFGGTLNIGSSSPAAICGLTERGNRISLLHSEYNGGSKSTYFDEGKEYTERASFEKLQFKMAIDGMYPKTLDALSLTSFSLEFDSLHEWSELTGFDFPNHVGEEIHLKYAHIKPEVFKTTDLTIEMHVLESIAHSNFDPNISQRLGMTVRLNKTLSVDEAFILVRKLRGFFRFISGQDLSITGFYFKDEVSGVPYRCLIPSRFFRKRVEPFHPHRSLFRFKEVKSHFENMLQKWLLAYDAHTSLFDRFIWYLDDPKATFEGRFLGLIQCFEGFHRDLFDKNSNSGKHIPKKQFRELANSIISGLPPIDNADLKKKIESSIYNSNSYSLQDRLSNAIRCFKNDIIYWISDGEEFSDLIGMWRNTQSHGSSRHADISFEKVVIYQRRLEILTFMVLISYLGLPPSAIKDRVGGLPVYGFPVRLP